MLIDSESTLEDEMIITSIKKEKTIDCKYNGMNYDKLNLKKEKDNTNNINKFF